MQYINDIYFIAQSVYYKQIGDVTDGALYYHTKRVKPYWSKEMTRVAMIDQHIFYKPQVYNETSYYWSWSARQRYCC